MKITNQLAAVVATAAIGALAAHELPLQMPALAQEASAAGTTEGAAPEPAARPTAGSTIEPQALALAKQADAAYKALRSYSSTVKTTALEPGSRDAESNRSFSGTLRWSKPNRFAVRLAGSKDTMNLVSNGTTMFVSTSSDTKRYLKQSAQDEPGGSNVISLAMVQNGTDALFVAPLLSEGGLMETLGLNQNKFSATLSLGQPETIGGVAVDVLNASVTDPSNPSTKANFALALGQADHLVRQLKATITAPDESRPAKPGEKANLVTAFFTETHLNVQANPDLPASTFVYTPQKGAKPVASLQPQAQAQAPSEPLPYDARLKKGAAPIAFEAKDLSGKSLSLAQFKGRVVLLDFWATWCGPCVGEVPNVVRAYKKYHPKGFDVVGISLDEDRKSLDAFTKAYKMPWRQVFDGKGWDSRVPGLFGVRSIPFALLIGRDGKIASLDVRGEALEPAIKAALARK